MSPLALVAIGIRVVGIWLAVDGAVTGIGGLFALGSGAEFGGVSSVLGLLSVVAGVLLIRFAVPLAERVVPESMHEERPTSVEAERFQRVILVVLGAYLAGVSVPALVANGYVVLELGSRWPDREGEFLQVQATGRFFGAVLQTGLALVLLLGADAIGRIIGRLRRVGTGTESAEPGGRT